MVFLLLNWFVADYTMSKAVLIAGITATLLGSFTYISYARFSSFLCCFFMLGPSTNCLCLASSFSSCLSFYAIFFSNLWSLFNSTVALDTLFEILRASISFLVNLPVLSTSLLIVFSVILPLAIPYTCPSVSSIVASDFCFSIVSSPLVTGELIHDYSVFPNCNSFAGATSLV